MFLRWHKKCNIAAREANFIGAITYVFWSEQPAIEIATSTSLLARYLGLYVEHFVWGIAIFGVGASEVPEMCQYWGRQVYSVIGAQELDIILNF